MAQLVFVHGVATRDTPEYLAAIANRDALFRELLFTGHDVEVHSPMWGQFVPAINQKVFDTDRGVTTYSVNVGDKTGLGGGLSGETVGAAEGAVVDVTIGAIGKQDPVAALDAICLEIADSAAREQRDLQPKELLAFKKAAELIADDKAGEIFAGDASSASIADLLTADAPAEFGVGSSIVEAVNKVTDYVRNAVSTLGFGAVRGKLTPTVGLFLGDVFVYLKDGEIRQKIRAEVRGMLIKAHDAAKAGKGPLVIVGHSMGGVILVDMLANPGAAQLPVDLSVDALLTVGSQPGFFATLDLLAHSPPDGSARRKPDCVRNWFNVFDPIDPLAFRTDIIFKDAEDFAFNSVTGITEAHSKYFERPQFYARSRKRLRELKVL